MDIFIDRVEGNGGKVFDAFETYDSAHEIRPDLLKNIAIMQELVLTWTNQLYSLGCVFPE